MKKLAVMMLAGAFALPIFAQAPAQTGGTSSSTTTTTTTKHKTKKHAHSKARSKKNTEAPPKAQ